MLAIRADIPVPVLKDTIAQFPSFSEAFVAALRALPNGPGTMMDHHARAMMDASLAEAR